MNLRVVVHDFAAHPFQLELSHTLAGRGHDVLHLYSAAFQGPKGRVDAPSNRPLRIRPVDAGLTFAKYGMLRRVVDELRYGRRLFHLAAAHRPDVVLSANTPLLAQVQLLRHERDFAVINWWQDVQSNAARERFGGSPVAIAGSLLGVVEQKILQRSDATIGISELFRQVALEWGVDPRRLHVIRNWAPLAELPLRPADNPWSRRYGCHSHPTILYSGTLGLKHNPELLAALAERLRGKANVLVVSQGLGADYLRTAKEERQLDSLRILPFQPFDQLPDMLASADILVAILEPSAGMFSVPSKILTYLCAGRPIVMAVPTDNLAALIVREADAGIVVEPNDIEGLVGSVQDLLGDASRRAHMGRRARAYAEKAFDINDIADRFEEVLYHAYAARRTHKGWQTPSVQGW